MTPADISMRVKIRTEDEFGKAIYPHAFRHLAATTIALADPNNVADVMGVLAHATLETSEKYYNLAKTAEAAESYQRAVLDQRRRLVRG